MYAGWPRHVGGPHEAMDGAGETSVERIRAIN
jgi:hypothetical protein